MNPSSTGWIAKYFHLLGGDKTVYGVSPGTFYGTLREVGFVYGLSVTVPSERLTAQWRFTKNELSKVNLLHALVHAYMLVCPKKQLEDALGPIIAFYGAQGVGGGHKSILKKSRAEKLERILAGRVQENDILLKKQAVSILTHAALYADVLAFRYFLIDPDALPQFTAQLSKTMAACCLGALRAKVEKDKYDLLLLDLMQTSLKNETAATTGPMAEIERFPKRFANRGETAALFLLDLCTLVTFDDRETDPAEQRFLATVCTALQLPGAKTEEAVQHIKAFARSNATRIKLFENANPVKYFYKQANKTVQVLIVRNSSRLLKELNESGELLLLLGQSTLRDLNREERKKVKEQLLDICRAIPSLTIFLLPGGTLLLPLLVKFIPKLLPSAFHENRIDKN